jgi:hypothetical protein
MKTLTMRMRMKFYNTKDWCVITLIPTIEYFKFGSSQGIGFRFLNLELEIIFCE